MDTLYNLYDKDGSGSIDYREFASEVFGRDVGGTPARGKASAEDLLQRLREKLKSRGARGIIGLAQQFRIMDDNGDRKIDKQEFYWGLMDLGATVSKREAQLLLEYLDTNKDGVVSYDEFLYGIRGAPNATRQAIID